jgi:hypothetical protein
VAASTIIGTLMTDATHIELLASFEAALETASRSLAIARSLAEGYRSGVRPPDVVLDAYLTSFERDAARLADLREKVQQIKAMFRTH